MKKTMKKALSVALAGACALPVFALSACGDQTTNCRVVGTDETYDYTILPESDFVADEGIVIDGKLDESFYTRKVQSWYRASKTSDDPYDEGGLKSSFADIDIAVTTYFASNAVLIAVDVTGNWMVSYLPTRITTQNSGIEFYVSVNTPTAAEGTLFEMDLCAGGEQCIKIMKAGRYQKALMSADIAPLYGIQLKGGKINTPECTGYTMEWYLPYKLFGLEEKPEQIDINPFVMTMTNAANKGYSREWYGFGSNQSPAICGWAKPTAYPFDGRGFICNKITIEATGGTVEQERGYDWCVTGDNVIFYVEPDDPSTKCTSFKVNGVEMKDKVRGGEITVKCEGDMDIVAQFA